MLLRLLLMADRKLAVIRRLVCNRRFLVFIHRGKRRRCFVSTAWTGFDHLLMHFRHALARI